MKQTKSYVRLGRICTKRFQKEVHASRYFTGGRHSRVDRQLEEAQDFENDGWTDKVRAASSHDLLSQLSCTLITKVTKGIKPTQWALSNDGQYKEALR